MMGKYYAYLGNLLLEFDGIMGSTKIGDCIIKSINKKGDA